MPEEARREQILDVTAALVREQGFPAITIQAVAQAAGISRPIVYSHFGDLDGLLKALVEREISRALAQIKETTIDDLSEGDPTELMLTSLRAYLEAVEMSPDTWSLLLTPREGAPKILRKRIRAGRADVLSEMTRAVRPGLRPGDEVTDPELTARTISAIADEYARLVLADPERYSVDRLVEHARWFLGQIEN
jgi:AcrR family transcriptional regulator